MTDLLGAPEKRKWWSRVFAWSVDVDEDGVREVGNDDRPQSERSLTTSVARGKIVKPRQAVEIVAGGAAKWFSLVKSIL